MARARWGSEVRYNSRSRSQRICKSNLLIRITEFQGLGEVFARFFAQMLLLWDHAIRFHLLHHPLGYPRDEQASRSSNTVVSCHPRPGSTSAADTCHPTSLQRYTVGVAKVERTTWLTTGTLFDVRTLTTSWTEEIVHSCSITRGAFEPLHSEARIRTSLGPTEAA